MNPNDLHVSIIPECSNIFQGSSAKQFTCDLSVTLHDRHRGVTFEYNPIGLPTRIVKSGAIAKEGVCYPIETALNKINDTAGNRLRNTIHIPAFPP